MVFAHAVNSPKLVSDVRKSIRSSYFFCCGCGRQNIARAVKHYWRMLLAFLISLACLSFRGYRRDPELRTVLKCAVNELAW